MLSFGSALFSVRRTCAPSANAFNVSASSRIVAIHEFLEVRFSLMFRTPVVPVLVLNQIETVSLLCEPDCCASTFA